MMKSPPKASVALKVLIGLASFVIIVAGMRAAAPLIVPFLLAAFIAIICIPPILWLQSKKVPQFLSVVIVVFAIIIIGWILAALITGALSDFSNKLPFYQERLTVLSKQAEEWIKTLPIETPDELIEQYFDPAIAMKVVSNMIASLGSILTNSFLIVLLVIFMLLEASSLPGKIRKAIGKPDSPLSQYTDVIKNVNKYLGIKTLISIGTGFTIFLWLLILGIDFPILWGLLAFLLNFVPNIGSLLASVPPIILALIQFGVGKAILTAIGFLIANMFFGSILEVRIFGKGLGLSTLVVFVSLIFWGWVLGPIGMLLSVPLTMIIKIILESNESTKGAAILLGSSSEAKN
ncbi:MAG: AI-2E family transporter [Candidatus Neomarinimicrobiota bacterium]